MGGKTGCSELTIVKRFHRKITCITVSPSTRRGLHAIVIQEEEESHQHVIDILTECVAGVHESEHWLFLNRAQELCESRGGRPGLPVPNSLYGLCGRKATLEDQADLDVH